MVWQSLVVLTLVGVVTACNGPSEPDPPAFGDSSTAGLCEDVTVEWAHDEPGHPTPEEAVAAFVEETPVLAVTDVDGTTIRVGGEEVGSLDVEPAPAGGHFVSYAWWCYPEQAPR